ncbi:MAG: dihydroxyacetone kinase subunit DhaL [Rhizobiaceae bacterium]
MKKLINEPLSVVRELLEGTVAGAPGLAVLDNENVVVRYPLPAPAERRVAVISGGGSGHEPAHAGYVGFGMLTAAAAGDVFTSPSSDAVLAAIRACAGPAGVVLIVKNYTGDRLNFGLAAEIARAEGIPVEVVVVADDVSLSGTVARERRRGIAGTILVHKVAGAAAARGDVLAEVARLARAAAAGVGSMGVALQSCTLPSASRPNFALGDSDMELGLGIHGEPGVRRVPVEPADKIVATLLDAIIGDLGLKQGNRIALLVNGLGGTSPMELAILNRSALNDLAKRGLKVERVWSGTLLSALDMQGASLSLMALDNSTLALIDAPTDAPAWPGEGRLNPYTATATPPSAPTEKRQAIDEGATQRSAALRALTRSVSAALLASEAELTDLDARAGDGDLGMSMSRAARAIDAMPDDDWTTPAHGLSAMAGVLRRAIGGSSGPLYATALLRAGRSLDGREMSTGALSEAFTAGVEAILELGGARPGDRTMVDALAPAAEAFRKVAEDGGAAATAVAAAAAAARKGTEMTRNMHPRLGRASYLGERAIGVPDGGAVAVAIWLEALAQSTGDPRA